MPDVPAISVIVPFHNNRREIARCCEGILRQNFPRDRYEVIFVDNNSTDGSAAIVAAFPGITLLRESAPGPYAARNAGLLRAAAPILAFTDADCIPHPDWLLAIANGLADPTIQILVGSYTVDPGRFPASALSAYENAKHRCIFSSDDPSLYYGYTNNMAVRREVFDRLGPFSLRFRGSDAILVREQVRHGGLESVSYLQVMSVDHIEFQTVSDYYRKVFIHSRSVRNLELESSLRPLSFRERLAAFRNMVAFRKYSHAQASVIFLLLALGMVFWAAGRLFPSPELPRLPDRSQ